MTSTLTRTLGIFGAIALMVLASLKLPISHFWWLVLVLGVFPICAVSLNTVYRAPKDVYRPQLANLGYILGTGVVVFFPIWGFIAIWWPYYGDAAHRAANWLASQFGPHQPLSGYETYAMLSATMVTVGVVIGFIAEFFEQRRYDREQGYR